MNSALRKLGAEAISSKTDDSNRARLVAGAYPILRDKLQRAHPWNFCLAYEVLTQTVSPPTGVFNYGYFFAKPASCLRIIGSNLGPDACWEEVTGDLLATNDSTLTVRFIKRITDVTKFDDTFIEVLAWMIAADIAYALTQSDARVQTCEQKIKEELQGARFYDSQVGNARAIVGGDTWVQARRRW